MIKLKSGSQCHIEECTCNKVWFRETMEKEMWYISNTKDPRGKINHQSIYYSNEHLLVSQL